MTFDTSTRQGLEDTTAHMGPLIRSVKSVANRSRKAGHAIDPRNDAAYNKIDAFFECLDQVAMTPELRERANIHEILRLFFAREDCFFPDHYKTSANTLFDKFEAMHWGGVPNDANASKASAPSEPQILMPPRNHPIWGDKGIMAGLAYHKLPSGELSIVAIPGSARSAKVYGDNGLTKGIHYPSAEEPAYSVIISGPEYLEVNNDRWDVVFYCGTGSHENQDPEKIIEGSGTRALEASIAPGRPVRVLRTSKARSSTPVFGVRYDGLYEVKGNFVRYNKHGGRCLAFELRRLPDQRSRDECLRIPNVHQQTHFKKIEEGYQYQGRFYGGNAWEK